MHYGAHDDDIYIATGCNDDDLGGNDINDHIVIHLDDNDLAVIDHVTPDDFDIGAVRIEYDGRTYHLVADDEHGEHNCPLYAREHDDPPLKWDDDGQPDDAPGDDLDRLRNEYHDAEHLYTAAYIDAAEYSIAHDAYLAALRAARNPLT